MQRKRPLKGRRRDGFCAGLFLCVMYVEGGGCCSQQILLLCLSVPVSYLEKVRGKGKACTQIMSWQDPSLPTFLSLDCQLMIQSASLKRVDMTLELSVTDPCPGLGEEGVR